MRLAASNEVIRAQKRCVVHRELFIGRDRAGKRSPRPMEDRRNIFQVGVALFAPSH